MSVEELRGHLVELNAKGLNQRGTIRRLMLNQATTATTPDTPPTPATPTVNPATSTASKTVLDLANVSFIYVFWFVFVNVIRLSEYSMLILRHFGLVDAHTGSLIFCTIHETHNIMLINEVNFYPLHCTLRSSLKTI